MDVLQYKRKRRFAFVVALATFADGAGRRVEKKCAVICLAVVITSSAKSQRPRENQKRRRKLPPAMAFVNQRGIKRGEIWPPLIIRAFERAQRGVNAKSAE